MGPRAWHHDTRNMQPLQAINQHRVSPLPKFTVGRAVFPGPVLFILRLMEFGRGKEHGGADRNAMLTTCPQPQKSELGHGVGLNLVNTTLRFVWIGLKPLQEFLLGGRA